TWPTRGVPPNPQAWIVAAARNSAIDRHRRETTAARFAPTLEAAAERSLATGTDADDELAMVFLCCHPALSPESQVALTLRYVGGLTTPEIARAFGVSETTIGQRLSRAKAKISAAHIPLRLPEPATWDERMGAVLAVVYAIFNEGYAARTGPLVRDDLASEGVRLARALFSMAQHDPEVRGLLALLLLLDSRRPARVGAEGELVPLPQQDRTKWRRDQITEGHRLVRECLAIASHGPYQVQAAIQAVHCDAATDEDTDWVQILTLYDLLLTMTPTDAILVNRAVAIGQVYGPEAALRALAAIPADTHYALAVRADLLAQTGRISEAADQFRAAAERTLNNAERAFLLERAATADGRAVDR
ncbi:MAG: sigma-70 family RNA polymerase sigma factor, partial [Gordonia amarae]